MSLQFDSAYYLAENPDVAEAINEGQVQGAKWHFDNYGAAEGRDPNATFDVSYYLEQNTDVAEAFEAGTISNPFDHFLEYGAGEGRAPNANLAAVAAGFDEEAYLSANTDVATAVENGVFDSGYEHWVVYGRDEEDRPEATYNDGTPVSDVTQISGLTEDLATLLELDELPAEYTVTDASVDLGALAVADVTTSLEKAQAIVDGAANADELELDATYSVEDTLSNLLVAEEGVLEGAASYTVDASVPRVNNAATVADATAALSLVAGAANADELVVEDLYVWKIEDSAANIVAAIEDGAVTGAGEVRVSFEEGDQLTVEQSEALNGLENLVGELPPVDAEGAVLAGLQALETAQNNESDFLEANADNELLAEQNLGEDPANAEVATAIRDADADADGDVVTAENAVLDDEAALTTARAAKFGDEVAVEDDGGSNLSVSDGIFELDAVSADTRMSEANLAAAATEAQADVDADARVYTADVGDTIVNADGTVADGYSKVYEVTGSVATDSGLDDGVLITDGFDDVAQVTAYDFTGGTAGFKLTVNGTEYIGATGDALATAIADTDGEDITAVFADNKLTLTGGTAGVSFTTSGAAAQDVDSAAVTVEEDSSQAVEAFDTSDFIANNESVGFVATSNVNDGKLTEDNVITETATAAELQAAVAATANEVTSARAATSDADLLSGINAAINGYLGAGGDNVEPATDESLLDLRLDITTALDVAEGETLQLTKDNDVFDETVYSSKDVLAALAGTGSDENVNDNGVLTVDAATAPETGEGTWVKGEETGQGTGEFTFTYEPSAEEQALVGAVKDVEGRVELLTAEDSADTAFGTTVTGGVFNTIEALQNERAELIQDVTDAEGKLTEAQDTAEATQQLVDQLDALEQQVADAEATLTDSAEEGGLGVNLVDFENGTATATAEDDVILFSAAENDNDIANFGVAGEDRLYVGTDFTINNVETGVDVADTAQGDASVQEMFVQQTAGGDTVLSFENEAFAGSATSGADLTEVTLTGVTGDVSVSDDGFLTIA